jgi:hypothetical protein
VGSKANDDDDNDKVFEEGTLVTFFILSLFFVLKISNFSLSPSRLQDAVKFHNASVCA